MTTELSATDYFSELSDPGRLIDPLLVRVAIKVDAHGRVVPLDPDTVTAMTNAGPLVARRALPPITKLFRGDRVCPEIANEPPRELLSLFHTIEGTAADWCQFSETRVRDEQFELLYSELRRRPDGRGGPLSQYVRAAAQVALLLRPTSASEFDAVVRRLTRSARTFKQGAASTNYHDFVLIPLTQLGGAR